jgi:hypothetical protein
MRRHTLFSIGYWRRVEEPEGLVEAEPHAEVVRGVVTERRVPHAPAQHVEGAAPFGTEATFGGGAAPSSSLYDGGRQEPPVYTCMQLQYLFN